MSSVTETSTSSIGKQGKMFCWARDFGAECGAKKPREAEIEPRPLGLEMLLSLLRLFAARRFSCGQLVGWLALFRRLVFGL